MITNQCHSDVDDDHNKIGQQNECVRRQAISRSWNNKDRTKYRSSTHTSEQQTEAGRLKMQLLEADYRQQRRYDRDEKREQDITQQDHLNTRSKSDITDRSGKRF